MNVTADRFTVSFDNTTNITFGISGLLKKQLERKIVGNYLFVNFSIKALLFSN